MTVESIEETFDKIIDDEEKVLSRRLRREPLTREFLQNLFSNPQFIGALNQARKRLLSKHAEYSIIVYKRVGSKNFRFVKRWGLAEAELDDLGFREDPSAHVSTGDKSEELQQARVDPKKFVRIGNFHTHAGSSWFSPHDMKEYDDYALGLRGSSHVIVPCAYEMFKMLGSIPYHSKDSFELFGFSMPPRGQKSNLYQGKDFESAEDMEQVLRTCGFRTARVRFPVEKGKIIITSKELRQLSNIGN